MDVNKITIKRINGDFKLFESSKPQFFDILPNKENILEIYFLMYGRPDTPYQGGQYIGKIVHNPEYPRKAPDYYVLTPNGRFEINKKICLTNSSYHQADWAPAAWNLVSILEGFSSVWHSEIKEDKHGISHISNAPVATIKDLASKSVEYNKNNNWGLYTQFPKVIANYDPYSKPADNASSNKELTV
jgi:ubiquitin-conjugating enzyme E2 J2